MRKFAQECRTTSIDRTVKKENYALVRDTIHEFNLVSPEWVTTYGVSSVTLKRRNGTTIRVDHFGTINLYIKLRGHLNYKSCVHKHPTVEAAIPKIRQILGAYSKLTG